MPVRRNRRPGDGPWATGLAGPGAGDQRRAE